MEEFRIDMRKPEEADPAEGIRCAQLCFKINHTMPYTEEYDALVKELFMDNIGDNSRVMPPVTVVRGNSVKIGQNVVVMNNALSWQPEGLLSKIMYWSLLTPNSSPTVTTSTTMLSLPANPST